MSSSASITKTNKMAGDKKTQKKTDAPIAPAAPVAAAAPAV
jgi:hypothetical protein